MKKMNKVLLTLLACSCLAATAGLAVACGDDPKGPAGTPTPPPASPKYTLGVKDHTLYTSTDPVEYEVTVGASKSWYFEVNAHNQADESATFTCAIDLGAGYTADTTLKVQGSAFDLNNDGEYEYEGLVPITVPDSVTKVKVKVTPAAANTYLDPIISEVYCVSEETTQAVVNYKFAAGTATAQFYVESDEDGSLSYGGAVTSGDVSVVDKQNSYATTNTENGVITTSLEKEIISGDPVLVQLSFDHTQATEFTINVNFAKGPEASGITINNADYTLGESHPVVDDGTLFIVEIAFAKSGTYTITVTSTISLDGTSMEDEERNSITGNNGVYTVTVEDGGATYCFIPKNAACTYTFVITQA